ncbi:MAG: S9 family peptidase [Candidatus Kapaibacterium sp.]|jgi:oligopeptidase B
MTTMPLTPPTAAKKSHLTTIHGITITDDYFWLRERENPEVLDHLHAENAYTQQVMAHTQELQEELYKEMRAKIKETDMTFPDKMGDYYYYSRTEEGQQYPIYCRHYENGEEEIILDVNQLAAEHAYFSLGTLKLSPCQTFLAYSYDVDGSEYYRISVKNVQSGEIVGHTITDTHGTAEWLSDSSGFIYTRLDEQFRPYKVFYHDIMQPQQKDSLLFHDKDDAFFIDIHKSKDGKYIFVQMASSTTSEAWFVSSQAPLGELQCIEPRNHGREYYADSKDDTLFIMTNDNAKNFKIMQTTIENPSINSWQEIWAHNENQRLQWIELFDKKMVICYRRGGLQRLYITDYSFHNGMEIPMPEQTFSLSGGRNFQPDAAFYRFNYTSPITPASVIDISFDDYTLHTRKTTEVQGYSPEQYCVESHTVMAADGTEIPLTILMKKDFVRDGSHPCLLYGYGSYGISMPDRFSSNIFSLLDRGFCYALAHIRGGGEHGEKWHDQGKMLEKINTFTDFIACGDYLTKNLFTQTQKMVIEGGSAGGLLMGAVTNLRPDLCKAVIAHVPFVDVINTMLDPTLPLTVTEYEEWGNPNEKQYFDYMMSYSPYDNVTEKEYPNILAIGGLNDPRVSYWEPTKWVAKIREKKTDSNIVLLKTNMDSGHFGTTGRFNYLKEIAFDYAYMIWMTQ